MHELANQALVFIKPHAVESAAFADFVRERLQTSGIRVMATGRLSGPELAAAGIVDRHYAAIADYGALRQPMDLPVTPAAAESVRQRTGLAWSAGNARNAVQFQTECGLSAEELNRAWEAAPYVKLAPGMYTARLEVPGRPPRLVVNGFYPSLRERFTAPAAAIVWFDVLFPPSALSWRAFRADVIGATNPAAATPESIRGILNREPERFGLPRTTSVQLNGVHASAGPLEGARERRIWLPGGGGQSVFLDALERAGMSRTQIDTLLGNPLLPQGDRQMPAFDLLEDCDAPDAIERLLRLAAAGALG